MAWDKDIPANDELLTNFPALCRANWEALELMTDANLLITNAKVASGAGIVDTKLAQITTASKVSGSAITGLASVPSGAGVLPDANSNNKLKADSSDTTPQYLDSLIDTNMFQISAGDLLQLKDNGVGTEKLVNGASSPGNSKYYGTNSGGTKGFFDLPSVSILDDVGDVVLSSIAQGAILYRNGSNQWVNLPAGTNGYFLKTQGAGANPAWAQISNLDAPTVATGSVYCSARFPNDTGGGGKIGTSYVVIRRIQVFATGTIKTRMHLESNSSGKTIYGRVYKNGVAVGTERSDTSSYHTYDENISVTYGDILELYCKSNDASIAHYFGFSLLGASKVPVLDLNIIPTITYSVGYDYYFPMGSGEYYMAVRYDGTNSEVVKVIAGTATVV